MAARPKKHRDMGCEYHYSMSMEEKMEQVGLHDPQEKLNVIIAVDSSVYSKQALQCKLIS